MIRFTTLLPAAVLVGFGAAAMWAALSTYITQLAQIYSKLVGKDTDAVIVRFFGFFFFYISNTRHLGKFDL